MKRYRYMAGLIVLLTLLSTLIEIRFPEHGWIAWLCTGYIIGVCDQKFFIQ